MTARGVVATWGVAVATVATTATVLIARYTPQYAVTVGRNVSGYTSVNPPTLHTAQLQSSWWVLYIAAVWLVGGVLWATITLRTLPRPTD